jgi:hypothetical protein
MIDLSLRHPLRLAARAAATCRQFPLDRVEQLHPNWCWAAVGRELLTLFQVAQPSDVPGVVRLAFGCQDPLGDGTCNAAAEIECVLDALGFGYAKVKIPEVLEAAIAAGQPIVTSTLEAGTFVHFLVVHGYCGDPGAPDVPLTVADSNDDFEAHSWTLLDFALAASFLVSSHRTPSEVKLCRRVALRPRAGSVSPAGPTPEPADAIALIERRLPALLAALFPGRRLEGAAGYEVSAGLPLQSWRVDGVVHGDLEKIVFLGWRHVVLSAGEPLLVVDVRPEGRGVAFRRASRGPAVAGIHRAIEKLAGEVPAPSDVAILEVPSLAVQVLRYRAGAPPGDKVLTAFTPSPDLDVDGADLGAFAAAAARRAEVERLTRKP